MDQVSETREWDRKIRVAILSVMKSALEARNLPVAKSLGESARMVLKRMEGDYTSEDCWLRVERLKSCTCGKH